MDLTMTHEFDRPIEDVWAMFHDPASHVAKFESMGHSELEVLEETVDDTSLTLSVRRVVDIEVPSIAKKFFPGTNRVVSRDYWADRGDGTYGGEFSADIAGVPQETKGTTRLVPADGGGCEYTVKVSVKVKVPVIGGKIADALRGRLEEQLESEFEAAEAWLAEH